MELPTVVQIVVALLGALAPYAWPLVVLAGLLLFRRQLTMLARRIENAKLPGGTEVLFKKGLEEVEEHSALPPAQEPTPRDAGNDPEPDDALAGGDERAKHASADAAQETSEASTDLRELASSSPEAAILMAYKRLEGTVSRVVEEEGGASERGLLGPTALGFLARSGRLSDLDISNLAELRRLRNMAAHHPASGLDYESAARYLDLVDDQLRKMARLRVVIRNNAVVAGAFPTGGPWVRDGHPLLTDGEYEIIRYADGTWRLMSDRDAVVFRRLRAGS